MIEIKNRLSNSREKKHQHRFNMYMILKRKVRYKFEKIFPLTQQEKSMYKDLSSLHRETSKPEKGKYFKLNKRIHMLSVISKDELDNFSSALINMYKNNPCKSPFTRTIVDERLRESILSFKGATKNDGWTNIGFFSPNDISLNNIVKKIHIIIFGLSDDYIGICFEISLTDDFNEYFNKELVSDVEHKENYSAFYVGNKKFVSRYDKAENIIRKEKIDDILVEVKLRVYDFLKKYINLPTINEKSPISIDEYATNYEFDDKRDHFMMSYDIYDFIERNIHSGIEVVYQGKTQEFIREKFYFSCSERKKSINRSAKVVLKLRDKYQDNFLIFNELVNIYSMVLQFYIINELDTLISEERKLLSKMYDEKALKIYDKYNLINKEITNYKMILNNIEPDKHCDCYYNNEILKNFEYQNKRFLKLMEKHSSIEKEFSNIMATKNYSSSHNLARISIIIAVVSVIFSSILTIMIFYLEHKEEISFDIPFVENNKKDDKKNSS